MSHSLPVHAGAVAAMCVLALTGLARQAVVHVRFVGDSSWLRHECLDPCDCVAHDTAGPMTGVMVLVFVGPDAQGYDVYRVGAMRATVHLATGPRRLEGDGLYRIGGQLARREEIRLSLALSGEPAEKYESGLAPAGNGPPDLKLDAQAPHIGCHQSGALLVTVKACAADFDGDGFVTGDDADAFVLAFEAGDPWADFNVDGFVTGDDFDGFMGAFEAGCG